MSGGPFWGPGGSGHIGGPGPAFQLLCREGNSEVKSIGPPPHFLLGGPGESSPLSPKAAHFTQPSPWLGDERGRLGSLWGIWTPQDSAFLSREGVPLPVGYVFFYPSPALGLVPRLWSGGEAGVQSCSSFMSWWCLEKPVLRGPLLIHSSIHSHMATEGCWGPGL